MTKIIGLNVGGNLRCVNGRGWVDPSTRDFRYLPMPPAPVREALLRELPELAVPWLERAEQFS